MREIEVNLGERTYSILIDTGILGQSGKLIRQVSSASRVMLVSNPTVFSLYGEQLRQSLENSGFETAIALMPDGEEYKNLAEASRILDQVVNSGLERNSLVVALGGGVVGDLAGFVAAIYQRGIGFVQVPTTLLAQVDSSVGGKVAVNHPQGKNMIGSFHQPIRVIIDPLTLETLEEREFKSGLGEIVKYGIIFDRDFFAFMQDNVQEIRNRDTRCVSALIYQSCLLKKEIVEKDEKELGLRAVLNLGHTFGHAIEKLTGYTSYRHGEAVVMGTAAAANLAEQLGLMQAAECEKVIDLFRRLGILMPFPAIEPQEIYKGMLNDKKVINGKIRFVLPKGIGDFAIMENIDRQQVFKAIKKAQAID